MPSTTHYGPSTDYDAMPFDDLVALAIAVDLALTRQMVARLAPVSIAIVGARHDAGWAVGTEIACNPQARAFVRLVGIAPDGQQLERYADIEPPSAGPAH